MKLYNLAPGMNPRRVRIFLAEKGLEIPIVEVDMMKGENKTPEFLSINPIGTLPVLELDDGTYLAESVAICRYIEEEIQPEPPLFGRSPLERAQVEMWNRRMEIELLAPISEHFRHGNAFWKDRLPQVSDYAPICHDKALARMAWLDTELAERDYVAGDEYTVADITLQCALLLGKNTGTKIPEEHKNLNRWWESVTSRPTARA